MEITVGEKGPLDAPSSGYAELNWWVHSMQTSKMSWDGLNPPGLIKLYTFLSLCADMCYWRILLCHWCVVLFLEYDSECEMGEGEVWCGGTEYRGAAHGVQSPAFCSNGGSARETESHGERWNAEGTGCEPYLRALEFAVLCYCRCLTCFTFVHQDDEWGNIKLKNVSMWLHLFSGRVCKLSFVL